jgi:hypothetical protein
LEPDKLVRDEVLSLKAIARLAVVAVLIGAAVIAYRFTLPEVHWHQKLTVAVETPVGEVVAASVIWVGYAEPLQFGAKRVNSGVRGEGVVVDLGGGDYLFALLEKQKQLAQQMFRDEVGLSGPYRQRSQWPQWAEQMTHLRVKKDVPRKIYPRLVTFGDLNDPLSVREIDPDNLGSAFGPGYRLRSITLEITDEPLTRGPMETTLPWLKALDGGYLHGGFTSKGAPLGLQGGDFETGLP